VGTLCPACGAAGDTGGDERCSWCGLELRGTEAEALRQLAAQVEGLDRELWEIGERRRQLAVELGNRRWTASRGARGVRQPDAPGPSGTPQPAMAWRAPIGSSAPRSAEWSVDRVRSWLLWVGATLLTISALTFTTVAWTHLGNGGRALLLAGVTTLCVGSALGLRRRLPATAEAFTALSIALALIDWQALRRAGLTAGMSDTASWMIGFLVVSAFALVLGTAVGRRTTRAANALLLPLALELALGTVAGAPWSGGLGLAFIAGGGALAWRLVPAHPDNRPARAILAAHGYTTWFIAAILTLVATFQADTLAQALAPAAVVLALALAPIALLERDAARNQFDMLATLVCSLVLGAFVVAASTSFGPQGMLAWATIVASAAIVVAPSLSRRWTQPACIAGGVFGFSGLTYGVLASLTAVLGPLAWLSKAWQGSLHATAREVFAGPNAANTWSYGWPAVAVLAASAVAIAAASTPIRRRRALVPAPWALGGVATLVTLAACVTPVVAGASVGVTCAIVTATMSALLIGGAALDRSHPRLGIVLIPIAILPTVAATGWASLTPTASIVVLAIGFVVAVLATAIAASPVVRAALGGLSGVAAITLAGAATASGTNPGPAGFAIVLAAGVVILAGVHARRAAPEGVALEVVGAAGLLVGSAVATQDTAWLAGSLTTIVPILLVAALRRDLRSAYSIAAGAAALGATWAWLAAANVTVVEAYTLPAAALALGVGVFQWRRGPAHSWLALGPAIVLAVGPTLVLGIAQDDTARTLIAAGMAFATVALGAWKKLQAPLVLGSLALVTLGIDTFGPAVARLPRWLPLAVIGLLLMWIGATFETRRNRAKQATQTLAQFG
jgi:hypothetical protein